MLKTIFIFAASIIPVIASASPMQDRAQQIQGMSNTYGLPPIPSDVLGVNLPRGAAVILLDECQMTNVYTFENFMAGEIRVFTTQDDLASVTFGLPDSDVPYQTIEIIGEDEIIVGSIHFRTGSNVTVSIRHPLPDFLGPPDALKFPIVGTFEMEHWHYTSNRGTQADIIALSNALLAYQNDFCRGVS